MDIAFATVEAAPTTPYSPGMEQAHPPSPAVAEPVVDDDYLAEMRAWLGEAVLADLLTGAPASFRPAMAELTANWRAGAVADMREVAHRLAGAAASVGARRLAELARRCQRMPEAECGDAVVLGLETAVDEALAALAAIVEDASPGPHPGPHATPVPPNPQ